MSSEPPDIMPQWMKDALLASKQLQQELDGLGVGRPQNPLSQSANTPPRAKAKAENVGVKYKSEGERRYREYGYTTLVYPEEEPVLIIYEPLSLKVPGGRYTPDFLVLYNSGYFVLVEVKESPYQPSFRDCAAKLRASAELYPFFTFALAMENKKLHLFEHHFIIPGEPLPYLKHKAKKKGKQDEGNGNETD